MMISTRTRYGMRALIMLAQNYGKGPLQIKTIAEVVDISGKYLEQLINILKVNGTVQSLRGPRGGYFLAIPPEQIALKQIFLALEGQMLSTDCSEHPDFNTDCAECKTNQVLQKMQSALVDVLESTTLADMV